MFMLVVKRRIPDRTRYVKVAALLQLNVRK
jgi:hypothetical protein